MLLLMIMAWRWSIGTTRCPIVIASLEVGKGGATLILQIF
jgi:hypothetical protein